MDDVYSVFGLDRLVALVVARYGQPDEREKTYVVYRQGDLDIIIQAQSIVMTHNNKHTPMPRVELWRGDQHISMSVPTGLKENAEDIAYSYVLAAFAFAEMMRAPDPRQLQKAA